jgi:hypothetical protein
MLPGITMDSPGIVLGGDPATGLFSRFFSSQGSAVNFPAYGKSRGLTIVRPAPTIAAK